MRVNGVCASSMKCLTDIGHMNPLFTTMLLLPCSWWTGLRHLAIIELTYQEHLIRPIIDLMNSSKVLKPRATIDIELITRTCRILDHWSECSLISPHSFPICISSIISFPKKINISYPITRLNSNTNSLLLFLMDNGINAFIRCIDTLK